MKDWWAKLPAILGEGQYVEEKGNMLVFPASTGQVSSIVKLAHENNAKVAVKKSGAGANVREPVLILDLSKMNEIIEVDKENLTASVMSGIVLSTFQAKMKKQGFYFPPISIWDYTSPMIEAIAANHTGLNTGRYGKWREYILGVEVVLPTGEVLSVGGKNIKCVSGLDLMGLFIGSHSQLGIITRVLVRLLPKPKARKLLIASASSLLDAVNATNSLGPRGLLPARNEVITSRLALEMQLPGIEKGQIAVLTEVEGFAESLQRQLAEIDVVYQKYGIKRRQIISEENEIEKSTKEPSPCVWSGYFSRAHAYPPTYSFTVLPAKTPLLIGIIDKAAGQAGISHEMIIHCGVVAMDVFIDAHDLSGLMQFEEMVLKELRLIGGKMAGEKIGILSHIGELKQLEAGLRRLFDPHGIMVG